MAQRAIDGVLSVLAAIVALALSTPFWRHVEYWPVSATAWYVYVVLGFVLSVYVFYVFIVALHTLFAHDALTREDDLPAEHDPRRAP